MITKTRVFFNWVLTVFIGSFICTIVVSINMNDNFDLGFFWAFMAISASIGLIPLVALLISQNNLINSASTSSIKKRLIMAQVISYFLIFFILMAIAMSIVPEGYLVFLIGLPYLLAGISLTLASPIQTNLESLELEHFKE